MNKIASTTESNIILSILGMESQPISSNYKFENGVTESMLESFVNRNTFSEHKMDLVDKKFIIKQPIQPDKRTWTYYQTTPLGKVWAIKHMFSNSPNPALVLAGPGTGKSRIPQLMASQGIQNYILLDNTIHFKRTATKIKRGEIERRFDSDDLLFFFYRQLPRMKKHPSQHPIDEAPLVLRALNHAFFNLTINSRMTYLKPHKVAFTELEGPHWTWKQQLKAEVQPKSRTEIVDHVFPQIQKYGSKWRVLNMTKKDFMAINADHPFWKKTEEQRRELESQLHYYANAMEVINEYGIGVNFPAANKEVKTIKYFRVDDDEYVKKMYDYIFDSLTFLLLINLEKMQKTIGETARPERVAIRERTNVKKILEDPDLKSFRQQYKMERQQDLQESLNFLSDDN